MSELTAVRAVAKAAEVAKRNGWTWDISRTGVIRAKRQSGAELCPLEVAGEARPGTAFFSGRALGMSRDEMLVVMDTADNIPIASGSGYRSALRVRMLKEFGLKERRRYSR